MMRIKLMADYNCFPIWWADGDKFGDIDPRKLPLSNELRLDLISWAHQYDETLDMENPPNSGFKTAGEELEFRRRGDRLRARLQEELGQDYDVVYNGL